MCPLNSMDENYIVYKFPQPPHKIQCHAKCKFNFGMISQSHECQHHKITQNWYNEIMKTSIPKPSHVSSTKNYIST